MNTITLSFLSYMFLEFFAYFIILVIYSKYFYYSSIKPKNRSIFTNVLFFSLGIVFFILGAYLIKEKIESNIFRNISIYLIFQSFVLPISGYANFFDYYKKILLKSHLVFYVANLLLFYLFKENYITLNTLDKFLVNTNNFILSPYLLIGFIILLLLNKWKSNKNFDRISQYLGIQENFKENLKRSGVIDLYLFFNELTYEFNEVIYKHYPEQSSNSNNLNLNIFAELEYYHNEYLKILKKLEKIILKYRNDSLGEFIFDFSIALSNQLGLIKSLYNNDKDALEILIKLGHNNFEKSTNIDIKIRNDFNIINSSKKLKLNFDYFYYELIVLINVSKKPKKDEYIEEFNAIFPDKKGVFSDSSE